MASVSRHIRRNMATRESARIRLAYGSRVINVTERDEKIAALVPPPQPLRFTNAFPIILTLAGTYAGRMSGRRGR